LVGYLLNVLDPDSHQEVENYLREHPEAQRRLELLRRGIEPLAADAGEVEAPAGLVTRTLAHIAADRCRKLPAAPEPGPTQRTIPGRFWWRRADVLVAAGILLAIAALVPTAVVSLWPRDQVLACQENMHRFHNALVSYSKTHDGDFPRVEPRPPHNVAGIFVPMLQDAGVLQADASVTCPARGAARSCATSLSELDALWKESPGKFQNAADQLSGCYAYTLGYCDADGHHHGLRMDMDGRLPILADAPPRGQVGNSPNHAGTGQNVLCIDGTVRFHPTRTVGIDDDDIYVNRDNKPEAGKDLHDTVLGASGATPFPADK